MQTIFETMKRLVKNYCDDEIDVDAITYDMNLIGDIGLSSLELVLIICDFEAEFSIQIPINDVYDMITVGDMVSYLSRRLK